MICSPGKTAWCSRLDVYKRQPEALARLRVIYPNLMRLDYDNRRTQTRQELDAPAKAEQKKMCIRDSP